MSGLEAGERPAHDARRPFEILNEEPMGFRQWMIIALCIGALVLDGYDVLSISLAGAGIAEEWGLSTAQLGFLLPLELLGMALGAMFIGALSDFRGRRRVMFLCLTVMTTGMTISGLAPNFTVLAISRVFTGLGIGGVLATATALSSEFCNAKYRSLAVVLVAGGFSLGVWIASTLAGELLVDHGWRSIFYIGAGISLAFIPLFYFVAPESVSFLERSKGIRSRAKIGVILSRLGHHHPFRIEENIQEEEKASPTRLLGRKYRRTTLILVFAYLMNILTYYYFIKWTPPVVADLGFSASDGAEVLGAVSLGGVAGSIITAILSRFYRLKSLMIGALFSSAGFVALFPFVATSVENMMIVGAFAGFFLFAVIGGAFGLFAESFPSAILGVGSGVVLGMGRGGAVLGPWMAGLFFAAGVALTTVSPIMAGGSFLAGVALIFLPTQRTEVQSSA